MIATGNERRSVRLASKTVSTVAVRRKKEELAKESKDGESQDEEWVQGWAMWTNSRKTNRTDSVQDSYNDNKLRTWVKRQKEDYARYKKGQPTYLGREGFQLLRRLGFVFEENSVANDKDGNTEELPKANCRTTQDTHEGPPKATSTRIHNAYWEELYEDLRKYKEANGHCCVPKRFPQNQRLSNWVYQQRRLKRVRDRGEACSLTENRLARLNDVGFIFNTRRNQDFYYHRATKTTADVWETFFSRLVEYQNVHGNCLVPKIYPPDQSLSYWVARQRRQHRLLREGELNVMSPERMKKLEGIGFVFNTRTSDIKRYYHLRRSDDQWEENFRALLRFKQKHGHAHVPRRYSKNKKLAYWTQRQRTQCRLHTEGKPSCLTGERLEKLENIGFEFRLGGGDDSSDRTVSTLNVDDHEEEEMGETRSAREYNNANDSATANGECRSARSKKRQAAPKSVHINAVELKETSNHRKIETRSQRSVFRHALLGNQTSHT